MSARSALALVLAFVASCGGTKPPTIEAKTPELSTSKDKTELTITIAIAEGPMFRLGTIRCKGDLAGTEKECVARLGLKTGDVFQRSRIVEGIARIREEQTAKHKGTNVEPVTKVDATKKHVELTIEIGN